MKTDFCLTGVTTEMFADWVVGDKPLVVLLPIGSVEPHGPHLGLLTDTIISQASAERAAARLNAQDIVAVIAPGIPYGVTDCAAGFAGAVSIPKSALVAYIEAVINGFLANGTDHVCVINNHLEPDQYAAATEAMTSFGQRASVACPLQRRWARTLSDEFKKGECHAGRYETAIVLAADSRGVKPGVMAELPEVPVSLSDQLRAGVNTFKEMGMAQAYAGAPALASVEEGEALLDKLAEMIVTEVREGLSLQP
ncbi:creatininase family protein [Exilibacterium tricleocarpae]|uniref:Creatininase family protein n=1 Tax=Exilibacterium tricleocarpae TaxID=2591008 RepID=A0A545SYW8_9GAMM|nr:creatininase family protein [Exilibacterium tricleocarpae]TQV70157.1 creatininase family protein [Exilibacterium tricleocarpae]